jgi:hypothetical protein
VHAERGVAADDAHLRLHPQCARHQQVGAPFEAEPLEIERGARRHGVYSRAVTAPCAS